MKQKRLVVDLGDIDPSGAEPLVVTVDDLARPPEQPVLVLHADDIFSPEAQVVFHNDVTHYENAMLTLLNRDRALNAVESNHAQSLQWNDAVSAVARAHSQDMLRNRYFAHVSPEGTTPAQRLHRSGLFFMGCAENIYAVHQQPSSPEQQVHSRLQINDALLEQAEQALLASPGHRRNILDTHFTSAGIGIAQNVDGSIAITQLFVH